MVLPALLGRGLVVGLDPDRGPSGPAAQVQVDPPRFGSACEPVDLPGEGGVQVTILIDVLREPEVQLP